MRKSVEEIIDLIKTMKGLSKDYEVADSLGVGRGALSNAKKRNSISFFDELIHFCDEESLSLDFIREPISKTAGAVRTVVAPSNPEHGNQDEFIQVGVYSIENADYQQLSDLTPIGTVVIPREIYKEDSLVIQVGSDSMEKLLMKGTNAVIETSQKDIISGSVYAFKVPHEGNIVRECYSEPDCLRLRPYNKNYPTAQVEWDDFTPEMIIGKVSCSVINEFR